MSIDWYPLSRDCIYYLISIGALIAVIHDGKVHWYESVILMILYIFYIILMYFNESIQLWIKFKCKKN